MAPLSREEIRFFKREGYLIKRDVLDRDLLKRARERLWDGAPPSFHRDQPSTWVGPFAPEEENEERANYRKGFRWNFREPGGEEWMVRLLATEPRVWEMAEQMLGAGLLVQPQGVRGIYCTLPQGDEPKKPTTCHVDAHPFHLGVVGYTDYVSPGGGSFCVWPGSHRSFYPHFESGYKFEPKAGYEPEREAQNRRRCVDCHGAAGDVIFWHHRLGHLASQNFTHQIRQAVLYDFRKKDMEQTQEMPPAQDMWRDWSDEMRQI
jgi:hypothetical protein